MSDDGAGPRARDRLLADVIAHARAHGLADTSLRALAAAIGTSHRMLIYHFGSREGLLAAVVGTIEAAERDAIRALAPLARHDPAAALHASWAGLADPARDEDERLFFEAVALALRGRPGTEALREALVRPWLDAFAEEARAQGEPVEDAVLDARIGMALVRGLLLDLLATGDRAGVDAAFARFATRYAGA